MSGTQQHILPQFLLRGFSSRVNGGNTYTYVHPKGKKPFENNVEKAAKEGYFYGGKKGEINTDGKITKLEVEYGKLLEELRKKAMEKKYLIQK